MPERPIEDREKIGDTAHPNTLAVTHRLSPAELELFFAGAEGAGQPQEPPVALDGPDPWDVPPEAPVEPEGGKALYLSEETGEADEDRDPSEVIQQLADEVYALQEIVKAKDADNADLWSKLRQADADLTERDGVIHEAASILRGVGAKAQEEIERLKERMETQLRTIANLNERLRQAETKPAQGITLTLTIPRDLLRLEVAG